jgi:hypothetical protein
MREPAGHFTKGEGDTMRPTHCCCLFVVLAVAALFFAGNSSAQFGNNWFDRPEIRKFFNPVVGKGEVYETTNNDSKSKHTMEFAIVSKETVDGQTGYWFEIVSDDSSSGGKFVGKSLMVPGESRVRRMIIQFPGIDPMEMPMNSSAAKGKQHSDDYKAPRLIGSETITVPAGTFNCEHYQDENGADSWISPKVAPITLVKHVTKSETQVLVKTIDATEHITGTVKPFDPMAMQQVMRQRHQQ